ncbi:MAG: hypothetical protein CBC35_01540 [Planctomycetes bacterium TMED75]|nr:hypothetical protein [Planctomycetaceae bacterium]OUU96242.1 MAG: hypothetical protein CBC35_01540 [Planctomycetes bacterium TMED75]
MKSDPNHAFVVERCSHQTLLDHVTAIHQGQPERFTLPCGFRAEGGQKSHALLLRNGETVAVGSAAQNGTGARLITSRLDRIKPDSTELAALIEALGGAGELVIEQALEQAAHEATALLSELSLHTKFQLTLYRFDVDSDSIPGSHKSIRSATDSDIPLLAEWLCAFGTETGYQHPKNDVNFEAIAQGNINTCAVRLLEINGAPVALGQRARSSTVGQNRIGLIFVPEEHRGHGHAKQLVRALVGEVLSEGAIPCLFSDRKNPISNRLYSGLSFIESDSLVHLAPEQS